MRRLRLSLILPLLLLFAQHGAVLHELSHLRYLTHVSGAQFQSDEQRVDSSFCPACYAFAQVTSTAAGSVAGVAAIDATHLKSPGSFYPVVGADNPTPRSRGPPHFQA